MIFYVANLLQTTNKYHQTNQTKEQISRMNNQLVYFTALVSVTQGANRRTPDRLPNGAWVPIGVRSTKCVNLIYNFIDSSQVIKSTFSTNLFHCDS